MQDPDDIAAVALRPTSRIGRPCPGPGWSPVGSEHVEMAVSVISSSFLEISSKDLSDTSPCYALGAIAAAQLMAAARRAEPGLDAAFGQGDLSPLLGWLRVNVHGVGGQPVGVQ
jgi:Carboxypeptidase Taq (M32) metallopeptidase